MIERILSGDGDVWVELCAVLFVCLLVHGILLCVCARVSCKINERFYHRCSQWVAK